VPFRKLGDEMGLSGKQTYLRVAKELGGLPDNTLLTGELCDPVRFSGILVLDGKFIKVRGFKAKIPFIYGIDYLTHDIPAGLLAPAEDTAAFRKIFFALKSMRYPLRAVVCDERASIQTALFQAFPRSKVQLCQNHYLENLRRELNIRTDETYLHFFLSLKKHVFTEAKNDQQISQGLLHVKEAHAQGSAYLQSILAEIHERQSELFAYLTIPGCPNNTNLIELYNSHLNARVKSIKGFKSFQAAAIWLNAYLIRRRTKPLTDCEGKFKHLNGHASLELTIKKQALWPDNLKKLGIPKLNNFEKSD
jgi:transposase-like protein